MIRSFVFVYLIIASISFAAEDRNYTSPRYALEIDGVMAGWVTGVEGGAVVGDVVNEPFINDPVQRKHIGGVKYEDLKIQVGSGISKEFSDWIASTLELKYTRKSGAVVASDFGQLNRADRDFFDALITEIGFPTLDGSSKDPAYLTVKFSPTYNKVNPSPKPRSRESVQALLKTAKLQKQWLPANFRLKIDGLENATKRVSKIEAFTIKQSVARESEKVPAKIEIPNLKFSVPLSESKEILAWY